MTLERLIGDGRIHPARIEEVVAKVQKQIEEEIVEVGKRTAIDLGIHGLHPELIRMIGKMKYRSSYGQNLLQHARETAIYPDDRRIIYPTLGLTGEAGEVADKVKKVIRDAHEEFTPEKKLEIVKEIGDVMWYCATLARDLGYELDDVAQMNVDKLRSRMQRNHLTGSGDNR